MTENESRGLSRGWRRPPRRCPGAPDPGSDRRDRAPDLSAVCGTTIACGSRSYRRAGYCAQCVNANPNGPDAGTAFSGGPEMTGPFDGLQAEKARLPDANVGPVKLPAEASDEDAIRISDISPPATDRGGGRGQARLVELVRTGAVVPSAVISQVEDIERALTRARRDG